MSILIRTTPTVLVLALAFSVSVEQASAQAMVSYGHGVAKAAGAGAAVGGGIGGVLTGLGNPLSRAAGHGRGGAVRSAATVRRETVPVRRGSVTWDVPQQGFGAPAPLPLVGGVQASGTSESNWQPSLLAPSENIAVLSAAWGGAGDENIEGSTEATTAEEAVDVDGEAAGGETKQKMPVVLASSGQGSSRAKSSASQLNGVERAVPEGVSIGTSMDELLTKLGRPYLSFRGVAGEGYTDQYVFELSDGGHLVVYVLDGVVTHFEVA